MPKVLPAREITTTHSSKSTDLRLHTTLEGVARTICHSLKETTRTETSVETTRIEEAARGVVAVDETKMTVVEKAEEVEETTMMEEVKAEEEVEIKVVVVALEVVDKIIMIATAIETTTSVVGDSITINSKGLKLRRLSTKQNLLKSLLSLSSLRTSIHKKLINSTSQEDRISIHRSSPSTKRFNHSLSMVIVEAVSSR